MGPVASAHLLAFLDWLRRNHSEVRSLRQLGKEQFMALAEQFESSQGRRFDWEVKGPWDSTHYVISNSSNDRDAIDQIKKMSS